MVYQNPKGAAVVDDTNAVGDAVKSVFVIGKFTRGDDLLEGGAVFRAHQEVAGGESLLGNIGIAHGIENAGPGVMRVAGQAH